MHCFDDDHALTTMNFGSDGALVDITMYAFYNDKALATLEFPETLKSISTNAFLNCTGLTSVYIPSSLTSAGGGTFPSNTTTTFYCEPTALPSGWDSNGNGGANNAYGHSETQPSSGDHYWHYVNNVRTIWGA
jgi:hypothetical protein